MNLGMHMQCEVRLEQRLSVGGGVSETVFPAAERMLRRKAVQRFLFTDMEIDVDGYRSMMDAFFCETFSFQPACKAFYEGKGVNLQASVSADELKAFDVALCGLIELGRQLIIVQPDITWNQVMATLFTL